MSVKLSLVHVIAIDGVKRYALGVTRWALSLDQVLAFNREKYLQEGRTPQISHFGFRATQI
jgi:hypothetical protein